MATLWKVRLNLLLVLLRLGKRRSLEPIKKVAFTDWRGSGFAWCLPSLGFEGKKLDWWAATCFVTRITFVASKIPYGGKKDEVLPGETEQKSCFSFTGWGDVGLWSRLPKVSCSSSPSFALGRYLKWGENYAAFRHVLWDEELACLSSVVSMDELKSAIFSMKGLKAPGPDGIQPIFYQRHWETVSPTLLHFVQRALLCGSRCSESFHGSYPEGR